MHKRTENQLLLTDVLPAFAAELRQLLNEQGEPELAAQVPSLRVFERCSCGDHICASFYVRQRPDGAYGPNHRCVRLFPVAGSHLVLDVVAGEIACIGLLDCEDVREKLLAVVP